MNQFVLFVLVLHWMKSNTEQSWTFVEWGVGLRKRKVEVDWRSLRAESHHINQYSKSPKLDNGGKLVTGEI